MRNCRWMCLVALTVVLACTPELSTRERVVEQEMIEDRLDTWVRAMNNARRDTLFALYHQAPDLVIMWPDGKQTTGWEETEKAWQEFYGSTDYMNFVLQSPTIQVLSSRFALTTFRHSTDVVREGQRQPVSTGNGSLVWTKDEADGLWKIHASHVSTSPFTASPPTRR